MTSMMMVLLIVGMLLSFQTPAAPIRRSATDGSFAAMLVQKSTDVRRLETLVRAPDTVPDVSESPILQHLLRDIRVMAYARLGELGTPEAIEALTRLEAAIVAGATPTPKTVPLGVWEHPAWHVGSDEVEPLVEVETPKGRVALIEHSLLGGSDILLISNPTPGNGASWTRPRLTPLRWTREMRDLSATIDGDRELRLRFVHDPALPGDPASPDARTVVERLDLAAIERDSDGDGWTDLEEARLGLQPRDRDTDNDGIPDGDDSCPNLAPANETAHGDAAEILRRALFAVFAVGGSRYLLLVEEGTPQVVLRGYSGPVLYGVRLEDWRAKHDVGGVFLKWRILQQTAREAVVEITDYEGMLSAGGQNVWLEKRNGRWFVIARETTFVS